MDSYYRWKKDFDLVRRQRVKDSFFSVPDKVVVVAEKSASRVAWDSLAEEFGLEVWDD